MTSTLSREAARAKFFELRETDGLVDDAVLDTVWAGLATLRPEEMLGAWKGGEFTTGHAINGVRHLVFDFAKGFSKSNIKTVGNILWGTGLATALGLAFLL